jgi:hypothetical protein
MEFVIVIVFQNREPEPAGQIEQTRSTVGLE